MAVEAAVEAQGQRAFVLERGTSKASLLYAGSRLVYWIDAEARLTRLSTRLPSSAMTADVVFNVPHESGIVPVRYVNASTSSNVRSAHAGALLALVLVAALRRSRRVSGA